MLDYNNTPAEIKRKIASAEDTPADILQELSKDSDRTVRAKVASNPNTPTEVLLKLGEEFPDEITANPIFTLLMLENPDTEFIRVSLARSSNTPIDILYKLAEDRNEIVRLEVTKNANKSVNFSDKLPFSIDREVRLYLAIANAPGKFLEKSPLVSYNIFRIFVSENANTPGNIL